MERRPHSREQWLGGLRNRLKAGWGVMAFCESRQRSV